MTKEQLAPIVRGAVTAIREHFSDMFADVAKRLTTLEQRQPTNGKDGEKGEKGDPGASVDPLFVQRLMDRLEVLEARQPIHGKDGAPGKDADPDALDVLADSVGKCHARINEMVVEVSVAKAAVANVKDGKDGAPGKDADPAIVKALQDRVELLELKLSEFMTEGYERTFDIEAVTANVISQTRQQWPQPVHGKDGSSITMEDVQPVIEKALEKVVAAIRIPVDGRDGAPGERGPDGMPGPPGRDGRDGMPGVQGEKGRDGLDGLAGKDGAQGLDGKDGLHGKDGRDAVMGNCKIVTLEDGTKTWAWMDGTPVEGGKIGGYRGVFKAGESYEPGENVTHAGSVWMCMKATTERPGDAQGGEFWKLAVKRGMDGREGKPGPQGPAGLKGDKGDPGRVYN